MNRPWDKRYFVGALIIIAVVVMVFGRVVSYEFLLWDDDVLVQKSDYVHGLTFSNLKHILFDMSLYGRVLLGFEYLPVRDIVSALDWSIWGENPAGFHLTNLIFYMGACLLLYLVFVRHGIGAWLSFTATLLFVLHPSHVVMPAWVTERKGTLAMFFLLLSFNCYLSARRHSGREGGRWLVFAVISFAAALLSRHGSVVYPLLLIAYELTVGRDDLKDYKKTLGRIAVFFIPVAIFFPIQLKVARVVGMYNKLAGYGIFERILYSFYITARDILLVLCPLKRDVFFMVKGPLEINPYIAISAFAGVVILFILFLFFYRKKPIAALAMAVMFVSLLPYVQIVSIHNKIAWRYLGLATIAVPIFFISLSYEWRIRSTLRNIIYIFLLCIYIWGTLSMLPIWRNSRVFWEHALLSNKFNPAAWINLSLYYEKKGDTQRAFNVIKNGARIMPFNDSIQHTLGEVAMDIGLNDVAVRAMRRAAMLNPDFASHWSGLAHFAIASGRLDLARRAVEKAMSLNPDDDDVLEVAGEFYYTVGNVKKAYTLLKKAFDINPHNRFVVFNMAVVEASLGYRNRAIERLKQLLIDYPSDENAARLLSVLKRGDRVSPQKRF